MRLIPQEPEPGAAREPQPMKPTVRWSVARVAGDTCDTAPDDLVVEEPLEVWVDGMPYAVLMRMPGDDLDLARGFCWTEGLLADGSDLADVSRCPDALDQNRVLVWLRANPAANGATAGEPAGPGGGAARAGAGSGSGAGAGAGAASGSGAGAEGGSLSVRVSRSSCGLCGRQRVEELRMALPPVSARSTFSSDTLQALRDDFEAAQTLFSATGGTHGAALYDPAGRCLSAAEDIGRHNALDKAIGAALRQASLEAAAVGVVSSRLSFEMVQKAAAAGLEVLAGFSAATSLAVELADALGITLVGFLRQDRMNVYTHPGRLAFKTEGILEPNSEGEAACPG